MDHEGRRGRDDLNADPEARSGHASLPLAVHLLSLVAAGALLVSIGRAQWFFADEWDFLVNRGLVPGGLGLFEPHNEHWSTVPMLLYKALFAVFEVRTYHPYLAMVFAAHLLTAHLLFWVGRRMGAGPWPAAAAAALFAFYGDGFENILWAFQIGFVGSVALGYAHLLLVDHDGPWGRRDAAALGIGLVALTFSGVTVTMLVVAGVAVFLRRGLKAALLAIGPLAVTYVVWLALFGKAGLQHAERAGPAAIIRFVGGGLAATTRSWVGSAAAGFVVLAAVAAVVAWTALRPRVARPGRWEGSRAVTLGCAVGAVTLFAIVGLGRAGSNPDSSRYLYTATALVVPLAARAVEQVLRRLPQSWSWRWRETATAAACVLLVAHPVVHGGRILRQRAAVEGQREMRVRRLILAGAELVGSGQPVVAVQVDPVFSPDLGVEALRALQGRRAFGSLADVTPQDRQAAAAALQLDVVAAPSPDLRAPAARVINVARATSTPSGPGCIDVDPFDVHPQLLLDIEAPTSVSVQASDAGRVGGSFPDPDAGPSPFTSAAVPAGGTRHLEVSRPGELVLAVPQTGRSRVCGLA